MRYHLNWRGEAGRCTATVGACPFGGADDHFSTPEEARSAFEAQHAAVSVGVSKRDRKANPTYADALRYEHLAELSGGQTSVGEWAEIDGFDGAAVEARLAEYRSGKMREAQEARVLAEERPWSVAHEVEAREAEIEAGIRPAATAAKKTAARRPRGPVSWTQALTPAPEDSKVIVKPQVNDPTGGYMGGSRWVGGKVPDKYQSDTEAAKLLRADVKEAIKAGELPSDLDYSVRKGNSGMTSSLRIFVGQKGESGRAEPLSDEDQQDGRLRPVLKYLEALGNQYATDESNAMVDYFNSHNRTRAQFRSKWD